MQINQKFQLPFILLLLAVQVTAQEDLFLLEPLAGKQLFKEKGCQNCHAIRGQGGNVAVDFGWNEYYGNAFDLAADLWNHSPIMREVMSEMNIQRPEFSEDEMEKLMVYLYYLRYLEKTGDVLRGKKLLSEKGCLNCHQVHDTGKAIGPRLDKLPTYVSPLFMAQAMWNHGPEMADKMHELNLHWPKFEDEDIIDLTNYVRILRKDSRPEGMYLTPGNPQIGKKLIESKGCLKCHAIKGMGGEVGPDFTEVEFNMGVTEMAGLMWNHGYKMLATMKREQVSWPRFTDSEMGDLISYLYYMDFMENHGDRGSGETVFNTKGCASCHYATAEKKAVGPDLSKFEPLASPIQLAQIMWNHAPQMETRMKELGLDWPELTKNELEDLYNFLSEKRIFSEKH